MALSLGEKLRQAREAKGITISEVAEQTRISSLYLEGIEADDYRTLPGGIFNKGFVKSYAKYVRIDEQEALQDYASLISTHEKQSEDQPGTYRPEVLTDDRNNSSTLLTIVFAIIILGLISWGAYAFARYYGETGSATPQPVANTGKSSANSVNSSNLSNTDSGQTPPVVNEIKVELSALNGPTSVSYAVDGEKGSINVTPDSSLKLDVRENLVLGYSKYQAANIRLTINGKLIVLPSEPENSSRQAIELIITRDNISGIIQRGEIKFEGVEPNANSQ
jgi:cytoskeleton protein RodZ